MNIYKKFLLSLHFLLFLLIFIILISAGSPPSFNNCNSNFYLTEDQSQVFSYNLSSNISDDTNATYSFSIFDGSGGGINSTLYPNQSMSSFFYWIRINQTTGVVTINSTKDNQTGRYSVFIDVTDQIEGGSHCYFNFYINATNDYPIFITNQTLYNFSYSQYLLQYINGSDEERHYPLYFNITFIENSCSLAPWTTRNNNCSLFDFTRDISNTSVLMNFTPSRNDVGVYYANISVIDYGKNYNCSSGYCSPDYSINKTTYYTQLITFSINPFIELNITDCQNKIFQENISNTCQIIVTTRGVNNTINISSSAITRNYPGTIYNSSWFLAKNITITENFTKTFLINVTPTKREVGNWSINLSLKDLTLNESISQLVYIYVNRTYNDPPDLMNILFVNTSMSFLTRINLTAYDDDLLIPDKNQSFGGYNETLNFSYQILNSSDLSQSLIIHNFSLTILQMPVPNTNLTSAQLIFNANNSNVGDYTINITLRDKDNEFSNKVFNLTIFRNTAPRFIEPFGRSFIYYERNNTYFNLSENVTDFENNILTYSYTNDSQFNSFNLNNLGLIDFNSNDQDVGIHYVYLTVSDGFLTNSTTLDFTYININETPYIESPIVAYNASVGANNSISCLEDNNTLLYLWIQDDDYKIIQKSYYDENLTLNLNITGPNNQLFSFIKNSFFPIALDPNRTLFEATFRPNKSDIGQYNISLIVYDKSFLNTSFNFSLVISELNHNPVFSNVINFSIKINESLYYKFVATDVEDGNSSISDNNNFTFNYSFISGQNFINNDPNKFNTSSGVINITFNSSQGGIYRINLTIKDSTNKTTIKNFSIYVYDIPIINYPLSDTQFNLTENVSNTFSFRANHSVLDNLTYLVFFEYPDGTKNLKYSLNYYGNNTFLNWTYAPSYNESTSGLANLSLFVYPSSTLLTNNTYFNASSYWNLTINNNESTLIMLQNIPDINDTTPYQLILSNYFYDYDAVDTHFNQSIGFIVNVFNYSTNYSNESYGIINYTITNWTNGTNPKIVFSADNHSLGNFSISAYEYDLNNGSIILNNLTSNAFLVELSLSSNTSEPEPEPEPSPSPRSSRGGSSSGYIGVLPYAFKIIAPSYISDFANKSIKVPFFLINKGTTPFKNININALGFRDGDISNNIKTSLSESYIDNLGSNQNKSFILTMYFDGNQSGNYEVLLNASSLSPSYNDWSKIFINIQKINDTDDIGSLIIFTEELLVENPECRELEEILDEAKKFFEKGDLINARLKAEETIDGCKKSITQANLMNLNQLKIPYKLNEIFVIAVIVSIILGVFYYFFKRRILRKKLNYVGQFDNLNSSNQI